MNYLRFLSCIVCLCQLAYSENDPEKPIRVDSNASNANKDGIEVDANGRDLRKDEVPQDLLKEAKDEGPEKDTEIAAKDTNEADPKVEDQEHDSANEKIIEDSDKAQRKQENRNSGGAINELKIGDHGEREGIFKDSFDPYHDDELHMDMDNTDLEHFDFDPSEGLSFVIHEGTIECFYETVKSEEDHIGGAYIVSAADSKIDLTIKDPNGVVVARRYGEVEDEYDVTDSQLGEYEICFSNINYSGDKLVTHVTHTLQSQHPIEKEHVSHLAEYAAHLDIKLGEFESEQRLLHIRTDRHIKTEQSTNQRVAYYSTFELFIYIAVSVLQVVYIKHLLDVPRHQRSWA